MARRNAWFLLVAALTNCGPAGDGDTPSGEGIQSLDGSSITSFTLINANTDQPIAGHDPLLDGSVLDLAALGTQSLSIRANTSPATVGSVRFAFDGASSYRTESVAPYALGGDTDGNYNPVALSIGSHTLTATPFSGSGAGGTSGSPLTIEFDVTSGSGTGGTGGSGGSSGSGGSAGSGGGGAGTVTVSGEKKKWHKLNIDCVGPSVSETASPNPFRDYRMQVTLTNGARSVTVPGYYACDGNAALSGASSGSIWRAHFAPDLTGTWNYSVSFRTGTDIAIGTASGSAGACDGKTGSFTVAASDKTGRDHRGKGLIEYDGSRYLRFAGSGERFLKGGADSPENFLAYADFDATTPRHSYAPHAGDWTSADPTWNGRGKNIIGALNYLAARGMNSVYFLTMNVQGDGNDTWPWTSSSVRDRFDCSKLDQWEIVFEHMDRKGLMLHVVTQETENDQLLDGGALGTFRKLYYRELVARFSHHLGLVWNLGEENTNTDAQRKSFATYIRDLDAYDHPNVIHTYPGQKSQVYTPLLGFEDLEGPSLQVGDKSQSHAETLHWIQQAEASGRSWFVSVDEIGPASVGVVPDSTDPTHDAVRHQVLWGNLMAGGAGVEWYFGSQDQSLEDWRTRHNMWEQTRHALTFFQAELPFWTMQSADALTTSSTDYVLADEGQVYAFYLPTGGTPSLDFGNCTGTYSVRWYNPRAGGGLATGSVAQVQGPGTKSLGNAPSETTKDWVVLVKLVTGNGDCGTGGPGGGPSVTSLTLINAATDQPIPGYDPLPNGATLDLSNLGTSSLTLRANTSPSVVGSVRFSVDGSSSYQTESVAPYALAGDTNGNYNSWTLGLGAHTVGATAYTGSGAGGSAGTPLSVSFTIVQ